MIKVKKYGSGGMVYTAVLEAVLSNELRVRVSLSVLDFEALYPSLILPWPRDE